MPVRALLRAAEVFGISENSLRVALARLLAAGQLTRNERGFYELAAEARVVQLHVSSWQSIEDRLVPWRGHWIAVHGPTTGVGRGRQRRRHERALAFVGLGELEPELWIRPDNVVGGVAAIRRRLGELGLEGARVFGLHDFDAETEQRARGLWDAWDLTARYAKMRATIEESSATLLQQPVEQAVVESFLIGGAALRLLAFDPLLPEPLVDARGRRALVSALRVFVPRGEARWAELLAPYGEALLASTISYTDGGRPIASDAGASSLRPRTAS